MTRKPSVSRLVAKSALGCALLATLLSGRVVPAQDATPPVYADVFGMSVQQLTPQAAQLLGIASGVQVVAVEPDSDAARAGIVRNDIVESVGSQPVTSVAVLFDHLESAPRTLNLRIRSASGPKRLQIVRPSVAGRIVFQSQRTGKGDVYTINADGTGLTRLTRGAESEGNPVWSPDGTKIAFNGAAPGVHYNAEVWSMSEDGTGAKRLSSDVYAKLLPRWSPDGKSLYVISDRNGKWDLCRMGVDGSSLETLRECSPRADQMAWTYPALAVSPDGSLVAFPHLQNGRFELALLQPKTGTVLPLTAQVPRPLRPNWNRAQNKVIVASEGRFFVVDMKTQGVTPLNLAGFDVTNIASITWSPKGDFFIVTARPAPGENLQLYLVSADGSLRRRLTFHASDDSMADWTDILPPKQTARK